MKNIIFSRRNLDFNFGNLELFSVISELPGSFRTRLHIAVFFFRLQKVSQNSGPGHYQALEAVKRARCAAYRADVEP